MRVLVQPCPCHPPADPPAADEVHVWSVDFARLPVELGELTAALTPDERDRAGRYRAAKVRDQFVACRGLLRRLLGGYTRTDPPAVPITYFQAGKPVLATAAVEFNLTHTDGMALIAVGRRRLGVDVERHRVIPDADGLVERFFSPAERVAYRAVAADRRPAAFLRGWTCKEAVIKAVGTGVLALDGFDVEIDPDRPPAVLEVRHEAFTGTRWSVGVWEPAAGFVAALAVEGVAELAWR
jgi:4'-phosphopantetheinyl transferase